MPSTVVHLALAGLLAAALLGVAFDRRALAVVFVAAAIPDLDSFAPLLFDGGHRTFLHNLAIPLVAGVLLWADVRRGDRSIVVGRWGHWGVRVAWVAILAYAISGVGLDMVKGGANVFYPLHDQIYIIEGKIELSDQRGIVQTFIEWGGEEGGSVPAPDSVGNSSEIEYSTGVNPDPDDTETNPERLFPVVRSGWELVLLLVGTAVTWARFHVSQDFNDK